MASAGYEQLRESSTIKRLYFLVSDSAFYSIVYVTSMAFSLITVPVLTRILSKSDYGLMDGIVVYSCIANAISLFGQDSAVARFYYEAENAGERIKIVTQSFFIYAVIALSTAGVFFLFAANLAQYTISAGSHASLFRLAIIAIPLQTTFSFCLNLLKWTFQRIGFLFLTIGQAVLYTSLLVYFLVAHDLGVASVFWSALLSYGACAAAGLWLCRSSFTRRPGSGYIGRLLHFGWPFMLTSVSSYLIPAVDRHFVSTILGLDALGIYAVGSKLMQLVQIPIQGFLSAWGPFSLAIYKESSARHTYNRILLLYIILMSGYAILLVGSAAPLIQVIASKKYLPAVVVVLPLVYARILDSVSWISGLGIGLSKRTLFRFICYLVGVSISYLVISLLTRPFGIVGVAFGVLFGEFGFCAASTIIAGKVYPALFKLTMPAFLLLLSAAFSWCGTMVAFSHWLAQIAFAAALCLLYLLIAMRLCFSRAELSFGVTFVRERLLRELRRPRIAPEEP